MSIDEMIENNENVSRIDEKSQDIIGGGWNYRLVRRRNEDGEESVAIHEVYYDSDGNPTSCTKDPVGFVGNDVEDLAKEVAHMEQAFDKDVLDYEDF